MGESSEDNATTSNNNIEDMILKVQHYDDNSQVMHLGGTPSSRARGNSVAIDA